MKKAVKVIGTVGKVALGGVLIVGHIIMTCVGALVCAITSQD